MRATGEVHAYTGGDMQAGRHKHCIGAVRCTRILQWLMAIMRLKRSLDQPFQIVKLRNLKVGRLDTRNNRLYLTYEE